MRVLTAALLALSGCATTSSSTAPTPAEAPKAEAPAPPQKLAITNVIPFDVASCAPRALELSPLNTDVLMGALISQGPATEECFVDPANRDGQPFDLKAKVTVSESGVAVEFTGAGASPAGKACVEAALQKLPLQPLAAGSKPVVAEAPIAAGPKAVKLGDNVANDVAGRLRLAQPTLCACYASLGTQLPPSLKAEVETGSATRVSLGSTDPLATCLEGKLGALALPKEKAKLTWPLLLKNSYATELDASTPPALRFQALEGQRAQRTADVMLAAGRRVNAAIAYDDLARRYKAKPAKGMLEELKARCAEVVAGDDRQLASLRALIGVIERSQQLVSAEKANDAQWAQVEPLLARQMTSFTGEVVRVEEQKKSDLNACPKTRP